MSDNEDLLGDDLGDHSLADYNLGNDEEDQLLADDYEGGNTQNVPSSIEAFREPVDIVPSDYSGNAMEYGPPPVPCQPVVETECVVPNIMVEVSNVPPPHSTYAPYEPRHYEPEHSVPTSMPAAPVEPPQTVPSEIVAAIPNDMSRERFVTERPVGSQRTPQLRDIPDSLDAVVIAEGVGRARGRTTWRSAHYNARLAHAHARAHPYARHGGNFHQRHSFPPQHVRPPPFPLQMPSQLPPPTQQPHPPRPMPQIRVEIPQERPMDRPMERPMDRPMERPMDRPMDRSMERPMERPMDRPMDRPMEHRPPFQNFQRFAGFREERPMFNPLRPPFERPMYYPRQMPRYPPPMREVTPHVGGPQVTIRQHIDKNEPEVRMLPVPLPLPLPLPHSLPGGLAGKKVLINPHFKGNFQPPVDGVAILPAPTYVPTRIVKSPPLGPAPPLLNTLGPVKDLDDAAERFIVEQRNALARSASRKFARRSPQRYIENTTIEIENELARRGARRRSEDDLLRRQEEFIHANRAGLRRRMRSPSPSPPASPPPAAPMRRSCSPTPADARRDRRHRPADEDTEYKRRVREQESMRERVLRAKEIRRRKNAALYNKQMQDREKEEKEPVKEVTPAKPADTTVDKTDKPVQPKSADKLEVKPAEKAPVTPESVEDVKPDTTKKTPERDWTPELKETVKSDEVNSTCEDLTPPGVRAESGVRGATPPLAMSDDELDLILGDIDGILSDDDDKPADKPDKCAPPPAAPQPPPPAQPATQTDLRSRLPPKSNNDAKKAQRQKIIFTEEREEKKKKARSGARACVTSSTRTRAVTPKTKSKQELPSNKSRQRIIFENTEPEKDKKEKQEKTPPFANRRVIIQRKPDKGNSVFSRIEVSADPSQPSAGIFSRAVRTAIGSDTRPAARAEPQVEFGSDSEEEGAPGAGAEGAPGAGGRTAALTNLPHGMTDTRLKTLAGDVQSLILDKEGRSAKITFKSNAAAETFKRKFNNKMVAASRLTVTLQ